MGSFGSTKKKAGAKTKPKKASTPKVKKTSGFYNYASEPAWMKKISNSNVTNWFYFFFVVNAVIFAISVVFIIMNVTGRGAKALPLSIPALLAGAFAAVNSLFFYLLAERSLD
jgi:hypothetical protein